MSISMILLLIALVSEMFLGDINIGPFSLRVYIMATMLAWVLAKTAVFQESLLASDEAYRLFVTYLVFIIWAVANRLWSEQPLGELARSMASTHGLAITNFLVVLAVVRNVRSAGLLAKTMLLTAVISGLVGILQWRGIDWAWSVAMMLHPAEKAGELLDPQYGYLTFAQGLAMFSIPFSYHLISFGLFAFAAWVLRIHQGNIFFRSFLKYAAPLIIAIAILVSQARSAIIASALAYAFLLLYAFRKSLSLRKARLEVARLAVILGVLACVLLAFYLEFSESSEPGARSYSLTRIENLQDSKRMDLVAASIEFISKNLLIGGGLAGFMASQAIGVEGKAEAPHSMFFNCLVYYGLPGLGLMLAFLWAVWLTCRKALSLAAHNPDTGWMTLGAIAGLMAYVINAQFHNDSFVNGGTLPWWLLGLLCSLITMADRDRAHDRGRICQTGRR